MGAATAFACIRQWPLRLARQDSHWPILPGVVGVISYLNPSPTKKPLYGNFKGEPLGVPGRLTLSNYINVYSDPVTYELLLNSLVFAAGSSILSVALATALAWITVRTNAPFRRSEEHTSELQSQFHLACRLLLEKKDKTAQRVFNYNLSQTAYFSLVIPGSQ